MATIFRTQTVENPSQHSTVFNANAELRNHSWHPQLTIIKAEEALADKPPYTYLTRLRDGERGFAISFVNLNGFIEHHYFNLIEPKFGIWRNGQPHHMGSLSKVICDMMDCELLDCKPL